MVGLVRAIVEVWGTLSDILSTMFEFLFDVFYVKMLRGRDSLENEYVLGQLQSNVTS